MPRRNHRSGKSQARRRYDPVTALEQARPLRLVPIEKVIIPRGRCFFQSRHGKLKFTEEEAAKALRQAQHNRALKGSGYVEKRYYACPSGGCGHWHLTSAEVAPRGVTP